MGEITDILGVPIRVALPVIGLLLAIGGILLVRRLSDPGPLARGEARWRYRDSSLRARLEGALDGPVLPDRTRGWWLTRVEFGIALGMPLLTVKLLLDSSWTGISAFLMPTTIAGFAGMAFGLWWMFRIYRAGARNDADASWCYRDR